VTAGIDDAIAVALGGGENNKVVEPTEVRRISYEESLAFERLHEIEYQRLGFEIVDVPVGPVTERAAGIDARIRSWA
jgi:predicted ATPase